MSQTQHTAIPWGMAGDSIIAGDFCIGSINHKPTESESNANAAFVILAVNAHADLVEALRHAEALISRTGLAGGLDQKTYDAHKVLARAALAKAGASIA